MKWALDNPQRFLEEKDVISKLEGDSDWLTINWVPKGALIAVDIDITIFGKTYEGTMTYPDDFPDSPPFITPRNNTERWTEHQYGTGGSLCLQWRAENWQRNVTGADIISSAHELLSSENNPAQPVTVPNDHQLTTGQDLFSKVFRLVVTNDLIDILSENYRNGLLNISVSQIFGGASLVAFVSHVSTINDTLEEISTNLPKSLTDYSAIAHLKSKGSAIHIEDLQNDSFLTSVDSLSTFLKEHDYELDDIKEESSTMLLLFNTDCTVLHAYSVSRDNTTGHDKLTKYSVIPPETNGRRLPESAALLSQIRVCIVGLGSFGSKIAVSLARSGVRKFLLIDDDIVLPNNLVRNELSWLHVGHHKVSAVKSRLDLIASGIDIDTRCHRLAGQESSLTAANTVKDISNCDIIIDATANPNVFLRLAAVARNYKKPLCWGELFAGGCGGLIARAHPGLDPNPISVRDAINNYLAEQPDAPNKDAANYDGDQETPLVAYDCEVGQIASALTKLAIDSAINVDNSIYPVPVYLIGLHEDWIFSQPFDTRAIEVIGDGWDTDTNSASPEVRKMALLDLLYIFQETKGAETNTTK